MKQSFPITGMHCAGCAHNVEQALKKSDGVKVVTVNLADNSASVDYDDRVTSPAALASAVEASGYGMIVPDSVEEAEKKTEESAREYYDRLKRHTIAAWASAVPLFIVSMALGYSPLLSVVLAVVTLPVLLYCGSVFFTTAWRQLIHRQVSMDTLVALSVSVDYLFSLSGTLFPSLWQRSGHIPFFFDASIMIVAFVLVGRMLEERAKYKTGSAIRSLMDLVPRTAIRITADGKDEEVPIGEISKGDIIRVRTGESVAVDGVITGGETYIDESMMSGEPLPVAKKTGDNVIAGTVNQNGSVTVRVTGAGRDTVLSHIIDTVKEAQSTKVPAQRIADKVIAVFVPAVISVSVITFIAWLVVGGVPALTNAVNAAVSVLVIACPCSLGLATPTAVVVGIGRGARINVLFRDATALESLCKTDTIVFDKTGTLTEGRPSVAFFHKEKNCTAEDLTILCSAERKSSHPLANAIVDYLQEKGESEQDAELRDFTNITGQGASFIFNDKKYWVGNGSLAEANHAALPENADLRKQTAAGATVVYFGCGATLLCAFAITDRIKSDAVETVGALRQMGRRVIMLSGDAEAAANAVGARVGVNKVFASATPDMKYKCISDLRSEGCNVAMVGDGINDSEALAQADVSIAIGKGSDVAINSAQVVLVGKTLNAIVHAIKLSEATSGIIRRNLFWAFIYNVISIPIAAGVLYPVFHVMLSPVIGAAAMALSSVSVVLSSLTLYTRRI